MCQLCRQYPCNSRCPNADEPPIFAECEECGAEIHDGDEYYAVGDHIYCEECVHHKTAEVEV